MDAVILPDGTRLSACFAADVPGTNRLAMLLPEMGMEEALGALKGQASLAVENPLTGRHAYEGYTCLRDARRMTDGVLLVLERPVLREGEA